MGPGRLPAGGSGTAALPRLYPSFLSYIDFEQYAGDGLRIALDQSSANLADTSQGASRGRF
jgi:hypothetical protein